MGTEKTGAGAPADASTVAMFQDTWQIYQKMVENNFLNHREVYASLHELLVREMARPFRFLDIACGDASSTVTALRGTQVTHYHGIDFSAVALAAARRAIETLDIPATFEERDFLGALTGRSDLADVIWIGLSLHHLRRNDKLAYMREVRASLGAGGLFLIYENTSPDGESRDEWLSRWDLHESVWTAYTPAEWLAMRNHVRSADFPETVSTWRELGHDAGFAETREIYRNPADIMRMFCFSA